MALSTDDMWYPTRVSRNTLNADQKQWEQHFNRHLSSLKAIYEREPPYNAYFRVHKNTRTKNQFLIQYERLLLQQQVERLQKRGHCVQMPSSVNASAFGMSVTSAIDIRKNLAGSLVKMAEAGGKMNKKVRKKAVTGQCELHSTKSYTKKFYNRSRGNSIYPIRHNIISRKNSQHRADSLTRMSRHSIHNAYRKEMENSLRTRRMSSNSKIGKPLKATPNPNNNQHANGSPLKRQPKTDTSGSGTDVSTQMQVTSENITRHQSPPRNQLPKSSSHPNIKQKRVTLKRTDSMSAESSRSKHGRKGKVKPKQGKTQSDSKRRSHTDSQTDKSKKSFSPSEDRKIGNNNMRTLLGERTNGDKSMRGKESSRPGEPEIVEFQRSIPQGVQLVEETPNVESIMVDISPHTRAVAQKLSVNDGRDLPAATQGVNELGVVEDQNNNGRFTISGSSIISNENMRSPGVGTSLGTTSSGKQLFDENLIEDESEILPPVKKPTRVFEDIAKEAEAKRSKTRQAESNIDICDEPDFRTLRKKNRWDQDFLNDIDLDFEKAAMNTRNTYLKTRSNKIHALDLCRRCFDIYNTRPDALLCERCEELVRNRMPPPRAVVKPRPTEILEIHSTPYCPTTTYNKVYQSLSEPFYTQNVYILEEDDII